MPISRVVSKGMANASWIRRMFERGAELRAAGVPVRDLSLGNPMDEPPAEIVSALQRLTTDPKPGMHRYMNNAGFMETRVAVARRLGARTGLDILPTDVVMTCGAGGGLNVALRSLCDAGDEVVILEPYFPEYLHYCANYGLVARIAQTDGSFRPWAMKLEGALSRKTRAMIINSPNNPTGVVYNKESIEMVARILGKHARANGAPIYLLVDDAYGEIVFNGGQAANVFAHYKDTLHVGSFSKSLGIPGERLGYIAVHPEGTDRHEIVNALTFANRTLGHINAPALMQLALAEAPDASIDPYVYQRKRDILWGGLTAAGYDVVLPGGAFYLFPKSPLDDDVAFIERLLGHGVLAVPGSGFGRPGHFRLAYCVDDETIKGAIPGLRAAFG